MGHAPNLPSRQFKGKSTFGRNSVGIDGTLTTGFGPFAATRMGSISDSITSVGDLYPVMSLKWNNGVHNWGSSGKKVDKSMGKMLV